MRQHGGLASVHHVIQILKSFFDHLHSNGCLFGGIAAAAFFRRAVLRMIIFGCIVHCIVFLFVITFSNPWRAERFDKPSKTCAPNEPSNGSDYHQQRRENQALDNSAGGPHGVFFAIGFAVESIYFDVCFLWGKTALKPSFRVQRLVGRFIFFLHD